LNTSNAARKYAAALKESLLSSDKQGVPLCLPPLPGAAEAFTVNALALSGQAPLTLWVLDSRSSLEDAHRDITSLAKSGKALDIAYFPPQESGTDSDNYGHRLQLLQRLLSQTPPDIIVTSIQALLQKLPQPASLAATSITIGLDEDIDLDQVCDFLVKSGYNFVSEVHDRGEASIKGGILDIWCPTGILPVRIELFGPTVDSMRRFDPQTQLSVEKIAETGIPPAVKQSLSAADNTADLTAFFQSKFISVWSRPAAIEAAANEFQELSGDPHEHFNCADSQCFTSAARTVLIAPDRPAAAPPTLPAFTAIKHSVAELDSTHISSEKLRSRLVEHIAGRAAKRHHIALFCHTAGSLKHITENVFAPKIATSKIHALRAPLSAGFECEAFKLTVIAESDIYGRRKTANRRYDPYAAQTKGRKHAGSRITHFTDIEPGDLVVHVEHGIGRYIGIETISINRSSREVLAIEYADEARLYVPMSQAHLLSRYIGLSSRRVNLHKLGGKRWRRDKDEARQAVMDLAADLLEVQAARNFLQGHAFAPDDSIQHEFAAAFPFEETEDQTKVIAEIKKDMQSTRPMDRLVCGDAGYGKTEVAMRAAFRAVSNGFQAAVLVPTTILAQQHFHTFTERMAGFNVRIDVLSRFCTGKQRRGIIENVKNGKTDIIIGTHALVSPDISFHNLGLVIIDEEQRFGVRHKEHLKHMKKLVDVLTLSATPIPRTLYMSMTGARDMSLLQTPPNERTPIETVVTTSSNEVIREAVLREIKRNGQIYYLHNRVMSIHNLRKRLEKLLPEARIEVAHGQMRSTELADVMQRFSDGEFDLLLCTTIIESGMDIPNANTILIDRADRFGIADLYQLRGRVGRSSHKAYAYLLLPPHGYIDRDARERIHAVRKHSDLGAGFNLAVRDMEIRGAGNILGAAQSGHIAAVGFGIYCQMLQRSIARLKGEKPPPLIETELILDFIINSPQPDTGAETAQACIPFGYIKDEKLRVTIYRRLAQAAKEEDVNQLESELKDRFGDIPQEVRRLLVSTRIRLAAAALQIQSLTVRNGRIIIKSEHGYAQNNHRFPTLKAEDPDQKLEELLDYIRRFSPS